MIAEIIGGLLGIAIGHVLADRSPAADRADFRRMMDSGMPRDDAELCRLKREAKQRGEHIVG